MPLTPEQLAARNQKFLAAAKARKERKVIDVSEREPRSFRERTRDEPAAIDEIFEERNPNPWSGNNSQSSRAIMDNGSGGRKR